MKRNIFLLIFLLVSSLFFAKKIKVLITDFVNVNKDPQYEFIKGNLADALFAKLDQEGKFEVALLSTESPDVAKLNSKEVMRYAFNNKFDIVIFGYYYTSEDNIRVHFSVDDVLTGRNKITYYENGEVGIEIYSLIDNSTKVLSKKMVKEIEPYPEEFINKQRKKRSAQIFGSKIEFFFSLDSNVVVNLNPIFSISSSFNTLLMVTGSENIFTHFLWELPNKKDYLGFGLLFTVPFLINPAYFDLHYSLFLSYAYKKRFLFDFTFDVFVFQQRKISTTYEDVQFDINSIYLTSYFYFTYLFPNDKVSLTTGVSVPLNIVEPQLSYYYDKSDVNEGINKIVFLLNNDKNTGIPIDADYTVIVSHSAVLANLHLGVAFYPNKKLGFNIKSDVSFIYINTNGLFNNAGETIGEALEVTIKLSLGISFKGKYNLAFTPK